MTLHAKWPGSFRAEWRLGSSHNGNLHWVTSRRSVYQVPSEESGRDVVGSDLEVVDEHLRRGRHVRFVRGWVPADERDDIAAGAGRYADEGEGRAADVAGDPKGDRFVGAGEFGIERPPLVPNSSVASGSVESQPTPNGVRQVGSNVVRPG